MVEEEMDEEKRYSHLLLKSIELMDRCPCERCQMEKRQRQEEWNNLQKDVPRDN